MCPCAVYNNIYTCTVNYYPQDSSEYVQFLRESHGEALKEEERRYRFLAEKHCSLIQSITHLMNKVCILLQIAFVNIIIIFEDRCQMGRVCHATHYDECQRDNNRKALKRAFTIMCNDYVRCYQPPRGNFPLL